MKGITCVLLTASLISASCGDMSHNTNEDHSHYSDSSGINPEDAGNPNATGAPLRNSYNTDSMTSTSGTDNAAPKSSSMDSGKSLNTREGQR